MKNGIFTSGLRTFMMAFFGVIGLSLGFFAFLVILGTLSSSHSTEIDHRYTASVLPNSKGVRKIESSSAPVVLQINIKGIIGVDQVNSEAISAQLIESREGIFKNDRVKALFLHINTPGGTVADSDNIYRMIKTYKKQYQVPVYAYVDGLCASGGMYVASAADKVYASDVSLIGSVGVLSPSFFNVTKLMEKVGIESLSLSKGKGKDALNPVRPWKPDESKAFEAILGSYYDSFVDIVLNARPKMTREALVNTYGAELFPVKEAEEYGYIDGGNYSRDEALALLLNTIGIEDDYYQVLELRSDSWVNRLVSGESPLLTGTVCHKVQLPIDCDPAFNGQFLYLYRPQSGK